MKPPKYVAHVTHRHCHWLNPTHSLQPTVLKDTQTKLVYRYTAEAAEIMYRYLYMADEVHVEPSPCQTTYTEAPKPTQPQQQQSGEPQVVRIRRRGGQLVQDCDVYIGRQVRRGGWNLPHSEWHNPFKLYDYGGSRSVMLNRYERYIRKERPDLWKKLPELEGKTLGCWCKPFQCHGDVLQKLVMERKQRDNLRQ